jgi:hypothetical protein
MVHEHLDGSIHIFFKEQELRHKQSHKNKQKAFAARGGNMLTVEVV